MKNNFNKGDRVRIINYGHRIALHKKGGGLEMTDISPELVGQEGIIDEVNDMQGIPIYSILGPNKHAWYHENQMEKIDGKD
jgi:hypothetical protein